MIKAIKFTGKQHDFFTTLNQRVNSYFKENKISRNANAEMVIKTIFMFALYFVPYAIILGLPVTNYGIYLLLCVVMGVGTGGIGLSIMHDANHGAYSSKSWLNNLLGFSLNVVGAHAFNWKIQHNVLHHTYTNVFEADEDISPRGALRFAPESPWKSIHRFQHIYAWFLYGLMTLVWVFAKDFIRLIRYHREGLVAKQKSNITAEWTVLILTKVVYFSYIFVVPILFLPFAWWQILTGFVIMHYVAGFILGIIFQPAHVVEGTEYFQPDQTGSIENTWAIHQLLTTTNFAHKNRILSWYVGGLNYQVEHHLFPNVCHVHYRNISGIVESTAKEFGIPYKKIDTFMGALAAHGRILKELGKSENVVFTPSYS
jgi:linoleoyl-CoA desaturase